MPEDHSDAELRSRIDALIEGQQYTLTRAAKQERLVPLLREVIAASRRGCPPYDRFLAAYGFDHRSAESIADFPPLPVTAFKEFKLLACPEEQVVRVLNSSGTTQQVPSRIFLDRGTIHRQSRALMAVLRNFLGSARRPYLVLDVPETNDPTQETLGARGSAIRGFGSAASHTVYGLKLESGVPVLNWEAIDAFCNQYRNGPVLVYGFTWVIWTQVLPALRQAGRRLGLAQAHVLHSGGWKALKAQQVSKEIFSEGIAEWVGCPVPRICDVYGMVEQQGSIYFDCDFGNKHPANFATVLIRDPLTMNEVKLGQPGLIEVVSMLPSSYPGHLLLTEDQGVAVSNDECPCGRKDVAFRFTSRVEGVEVRGCGDTLARAREITRVA